MSICSPFYLIALYENQARPLTSDCRSQIWAQFETFLSCQVWAKLRHSRHILWNSLRWLFTRRKVTSKIMSDFQSHRFVQETRDLWSQIVLRFAICNQKSFITPQSYIRNNTFQSHRCLWVLTNLIKIEISYQTVWDITRLLFSRSKIWHELVSICSAFNLIAWDEKRLRSH